MSLRNIGIPVQVPVHDVLHRIEEQSGCIAWDIYDCVTLEQILAVARKVAAKSQGTKELGTTGNTGSPKFCFNCKPDSLLENVMVSSKYEYCPYCGRRLSPIA